MEEISKEERLQRFLNEHPEHRFTKQEKFRLGVLFRKHERREARMRREALIKELRNKQHKTLQEIGDRLGISRERVRQILDSK